MFLARTVAAIIIIVALLAVLVFRLVALQIFNYQHYSTLSQGNRVRLEAVPPTRGLIFDRNGILLAENLPAYQLELTPEQVPDLDDTLERLVELNLLRPDDEPRVRERRRRSPDHHHRRARVGRG